MPKIKNRLFQPLAVMLEGGKTIRLQSREVAEVSAADLNSSHLQSLIKRGDIAVTTEGKKSEPEEKSRRR